jgi:pimeloyl-ACP methyl ester carboxylesterase
MTFLCLLITRGVIATTHARRHGGSSTGEAIMARHVQHVSTDFGDIAYTDTGSGPPAIFVHGVFLNGYLWRHVIERVQNQRRCIALDLLAHGETRTPEAQDVSFRAQAEMLEAFCIALSLDQVDLVANDSGGAIAQIFAVRYPHRLRSLTLTNCDVHDNWPPQALAPIRELVDRGHFEALGRQLLADIGAARESLSMGYEKPDRLTPETVATYLEPLIRTPAAIRAMERWFGSSHDNAQTVEIEPLLRRLEVPTLVVWGTGDVFFPVRWAHWLRDTIPGCEQVIELEGAKLFFPEERPDPLAEALRAHWRAATASAG